jgi:hypothetical protein
MSVVVLVSGCLLSVDGDHEAEAREPPAPLFGNREALTGTDPPAVHGLDRDSDLRHLHPVPT